jgi:leader peptidase (prepilin peptidase)/N-methyltransferase
MELLAHGWLGGTVAIFLGLCVGSFGNVAIHRIPREGLSVRKPARSFCPECRSQLTWFENIPLLSWVFQRGRCRSCDVWISVRYPLVELLVGLLFFAFWSLLAPTGDGSWVPLLAAWTMAALCVIVSAIDFELYIIPDVLTLPGIGLGLLASGLFPVLHEDHSWFRPEEPHGSSLVVGLAGMAVGGGSLWLMGRLGNLMLSRQVQEAGVEDAMGLGDVKWMAFAGTLLGPVLVLEAILVGCFAGSLVGIALKIGARITNRPGVVGLPFGPYLSLGILLGLAWPGAVWKAMTMLRPTG